MTKEKALKVELEKLGAIRARPVSDACETLKQVDRVLAAFARLKKK